MGKKIGVFSEKEVYALRPRQRAILKKRALLQLLLSPEIRKVIKKNPTILTKHPEIRKRMKAKLNRTYSRMKPE